MEDIIFLYINKDYFNTLLYKLKSETEILLETVDFCREKERRNYRLSVYLIHISYGISYFTFRNGKLSLTEINLSALPDVATRTED